MLKSDQQGFLIGEVLDVSKAMLEGQRAGLQVLSRIDANVAAMIQGPRRVSRPRTTDPATFFSNAPAIEPAPRRSSPLIRPAGPVSSTPPVTPSRDSKGRFVKGAGGNGPGPDKPGPSERPAPDEARSSGENRIVEAIKEAAAQSSDRMDPMIEAAKEVWEPMGRGWRASFGQAAEKKKERWYRRILNAISGKKREGEDRSSGGGGGSGLLSGVVAGVTTRIAGLIGAIPAVIARVFAPVAAVWAAWEVGKWIGEKINEWLVSSGVQAKLFEWIDGMRSGWSSLVDRISSTWDGLTELWKTNVKEPVVSAIDTAKAAVGSAYDAGLGLIRGGSKTFSDGASAANSWVESRTGIDVASSARNVARTAGGALGSLIGRHEGSYDSFNRGRAGDSRGASIDFSSMTVDEILAAQSLPKNDPKRLFAVGKYQVVPKTMKEAVSSLGIKGSERFTPELQEKIFKDYLVGKKRRAVSEFLSGKSNDIDSAVLALSKEFASVQDPRTGKGYYDGIAGNKASISADAVRAALLKDRSAAVGAAPGLSLPSVRMSMLRPIGEAPDVAYPGGSGGDAPPVSIRFPDQIGQNVSDRSIAHITTGGLGSGGG